MLTGIPRNTALAEAALQHALYFLELGAVDRATAYYEFAAQHLQQVFMALTETEDIEPLAQLFQ
ncbi:MAG: hypothetical protein Kow00121_25120 [Elainellaceae cyanobacterium]